MSEQQQNREPRKPSMLISLLSIVGTIVLLVGLFDIHTNGIVPGTVGSIVLILAWAIPGILIGLLVFRGFKKKASSSTAIIVASAFSGIVGGFIVVGAVALCIAVWVYTTQCC